MKPWRIPEQRNQLVMGRIGGGALHERGIATDIAPTTPASALIDMTTGATLSLQQL